MPADCCREELGGGAGDEVLFLLQGRCHFLSSLIGDAYVSSQRRGEKPGGRNAGHPDLITAHCMSTLIRHSMQMCAVESVNVIGL